MLSKAGVDYANRYPCLSKRKRRTDATMQRDPAMRDRSTRSPKLGRASTELSTVGSGLKISLCCAVALSCTAPRAPRQGLDPEIVELFPGSELCSQPAWLFPATRPSFGRLGGIAIFRKHLRVRAPRMRDFLRIVRCCTQVELPQLPIDFRFFG